MLTRATRLKLIAFAVVSVLVIAFTGFHYANLGHIFGSRGYYVVRLNLANGGGIYPNADVTYRGVSVGRVGAMRLTSRGIEVDLHISASAPPIPARLHAAVADLSAVGEQYVDLRPAGTRGPFLADGSVIPIRDTQLPLPVTSLLTSINTLATSLPLRSLRTLTSELATGFGGQGAKLQAIIDGNRSLVNGAYATLPQTTTLIRDGKTVLQTQIAESGALNAFGENALLLARELRNNDASIRQLFVDGSQATGQVASLLSATSTNLGILIANLLTTSDVTLTRGKALQELLSVLPADIAIGSTVINGHGARFGVALTFFDPLPCIAGYAGTTYRNGLDTSPGNLNTSARCTLPARSGVEVRGPAHAPSGGGVPPAAQPGLAKLLGVSP
ncbi:MAG: MCE family protein [Nocardiopsaceae bacterium]|jgi:phospholipid/cholesterol/gamma-HCH transport system substrate-binding protein|nr:MCE family protein [Nocardiopsaceae bacterium]